MENKDKITDVLLCECHSPEHQIIIQYENGENVWDKYIYLSIFLNNTVWYKRIKNAIKYIFGYKCKYGHFDEIILKPEDWEKVQNIADILKGNYIKQENDLQQQ